MASISDRIKQDQTLHNGQPLVSKNGIFYLIVQGDNNVVLYKNQANGSAPHPVWASNTDGHVQHGPARLVAQGDGNLVAYAGNHPIWASNTNGKHQGPIELVVQDDGNLVLYSGSHPTWASNTVDNTVKATALQTQQNDRVYQGQTIHAGEKIWSQNGIYFLVVQTDNNVVLYKGSRQNPQAHSVALWSTNTCKKGNGQAHLVMQEDGNLVAYAGNQPIWSSDTHGKGQQPYQLVVQNDGNLVVYTHYTNAIWASNTQGK